MNKHYVYACLLSLALWGAAGVAGAGTVVQDFSSGDLSGWAFVGPGEWEIAEGKIRQTLPPYVEGAAVAPLTFEEGVVSFEASVPATAPGPPRHNGIGLVRYINGDNYWWVRFGDYGGVALKGKVNGEAIHVHLGTFTVEKGRVYPIWFAIRGGYVLVSFDGVLKFVLTDPLGAAPGRAGFYTLAAAEFDNLRIEAGPVTLAGLEGALAGGAGSAATHTTPTFITALPGPGAFRQAFESPHEIRMWHAGLTGRGGSRQYAHIRDGALWLGRDRPDDLSVESVARMTTGTLSATVTLGADGDPDDRWFGFVLPSGQVCIGRENRCRLYQGRRTISPAFGQFTPETGRAYAVAVTVTTGTIAVAIDGETIGQVDHPDAGKLGQVGFLSNVMTRFDDFQVDPWVPYEGAPAPRAAGSPRTRVLQTMYRPDDALGVESFPIHGTVSLFFLNEGDGPARLEELILDGAPLHAGRSPRHVVWARQRPWEVPPGEMGEIQIRCRSLPPAQVLALFAGTEEAAQSTIVFKHVNGAAETAEVTYRSSLPPVQINFIAFDEALETVYVYLQNNARLYDDVPGPPTDRVLSVELNGRDVTPQSRIPGAVLSDDVAPVIVSLDGPLPEGREMFVRVATEAGEMASHGVRAFPSRLLLQMTQNGWATRSDMMEDIWNHGFNAVHFSRKRPAWAEQALALGLWHGIYGGSFLGDVLANDRPEYGQTVGLWLDEVDKSTPEYNFLALDWMDAYLRVQGRVAPFHYNGMVRSRTSTAFDYSVLTDGICRAQQAKDLGEPDTGRMSVLRYMEHRQVRRPSLPYYRDAEIPVPFSPLTREVLDPAPTRRRCLSPQEERYLQYANFLQGAKGAYHWAYTGHPKNGFYEIHTPVLRLGNGGGVTTEVFDYSIPEKVRGMIMDAWEEIGRINVEMASVGPIVARGDVCYRARVVRAVPETGRGEGPSVDVAATLAGDDSLVLFVLNQNFEYRAKSSATPSLFEAVDVTVAINLPPWLEAGHILRVSHEGITVLEPRRQGEELFFDFPGLDVSELVLITADPEIASQTRARHAAHAARHASIRRSDFSQLPWNETYHAPVAYKWHEDDPFVSLSDLPPTEVVPNPDAISANSMPGGGTLTVLRVQPEGREAPADQRRVTFEKGLVLDAGAGVTYDLAGTFTRFDCILAVDPNIAGTLEVELGLDGAQASRQVLTASSPAARVALDLGGANALSFQVKPGGGSSEPLIIGHPRLLSVGKERLAVDTGVY